MANTTRLFPLESNQCSALYCSSGTKRLEIFMLTAQMNEFHSRPTSNSTLKSVHFWDTMRCSPTQYSVCYAFVKTKFFLVSISLILSCRHYFLVINVILVSHHAFFI